MVERVDAHPRLKARLGQYYYTYAAVSTFNRKYLVNPPHVRVTVGDRRLEGVTVIAQNSDEYTYFGRRPIRLSPGRRAGRRHAWGWWCSSAPRSLELPTVLWRAFSGRAATLARHRQIESFPGTTRREVVATDGGTFPVQVDGDYIGQWESARLAAAPGALSVVA